MESNQFDRDITLEELLRGISSIKLRSALDQSLGASWSLRDRTGQILLHSASSHEDALNASGVPLEVELEMIGQLHATCSTERRLSTASWLELLLTAAHRYCMVADLHSEVVFTNYAELQREHLALQESERRYHALADQLEKRVAEQVGVIERSQRQLYQAEKLASVGSLAAGMAHEINNPIGFIRSNLCSATNNFNSMQQVLTAFHCDAKLEAERIWVSSNLDFILEDFPVLLAESVTGADRIARIVANLKDYANIDHAETGPIDLNDSIRTVMNLVGDQSSSDVELRADLQPLPLIVCDRGRFNQVLLSLLQNALQALNGKGIIKVSSEVNGLQMEIAVCDNGCGMDTETLARIFDPFFTLRDVGKGTGLGLTVSQEIITAFGGHIKVESELGTGSTFTVCLPLSMSS